MIVYDSRQKWYDYNRQKPERAHAENTVWASFMHTNPAGSEHMPRKPKRPCAFPGCPNLSDDQYCEQHRRLARRQYDRYERAPHTASKYGRAWHRIRARYVATHPLCEQCLKEGRITPVAEVHHIVPISKGGTHAEDNLMSLCQSCHNKIHHDLGDR